MKCVLHFVAVFFAAFSSYSQQCYDEDFPEMLDFAKAGVRNGIPDNLQTVKIIAPGADINEAIQQAKAAGGGVVLLGKGEYPFNKTIAIPSNIVLRGESREETILRCQMRSKSKVSALLFKNAKKSGLENLSVIFDAGNLEPVDRKTRTEGGWCGDCFKNNPGGVSDLYVRLVHIDRSSADCWVSECSIIKSGTDPVLIEGQHNTFQNSLVDRCYNKGSGGNGYYDLRGAHNLIKNNTIKRIRHFAVQQGAHHNVVTKNYFEVDINFHNKDQGRNLIEANKIFLAHWHGWDIFATGGATYGHMPPGARNFILNNHTKYKWEAENKRYAKPNTVYTFKGFGGPKESGWDVPPCNTFLIDLGAPENKPVIDESPEALTICQGENAAFKVKASGAKTYQWYFKGSRLVDNSIYSGTKSASLLIKKTAETSAGYYQVKVVGINGAETESDKVELTVNPLPKVTKLVDVSAEAGSEAVFEIGLEEANDENYALQWYSQSGSDSEPVLIENETNVRLAIAPEMASNGNSYAVKITAQNGCSVMSNMARLSLDRKSVV